MAQPPSQSTLNDMAAYSREREEYYRSSIRQLLVIDPHMSASKIQKQLAENGIRLTPHYILKLRKKVFAEQAKRVDRALVNVELGHFADTADMLCKELWEIILSNTSTNMEKIAAASTIMRIRGDLIEKMVMLGVLQKKTPSAPVQPERKLDAGIQRLVDNMRQLLHVEPEYVVKETS